MAKESFKFVYVPADTSQPIEEWREEYTEEKAVECLINRLKVQGLRDPVQVDLGCLQPVRYQMQVENIALISNSPANGFVGVNLYCDDTGAITEAPYNPRASDIATCCGKPLQVRGDAFLARVFDNEEDFKRLDFTLAEMSSSAPWVKAANEQNKRKQGSESAQSVMQRLQAQAHAQSSTRIQELSPADAAREEGNAAFKKGDYEEAIKQYSKALELDGTLLAAYNNRAMAHLKLGHCQQAEEDCNAVLAIDKRNVKALLRRGAAREGLQQPDLARQDYQTAAELEPNNKDAQAHLHRLSQQ